MANTKSDMPRKEVEMKAVAVKNFHAWPDILCLDPTWSDAEIAGCVRAAMAAAPGTPFTVFTTAPGPATGHA